MSEVFIPVERLIGFCVRCFERLGLSRDDAKLTSEALVAANLRGVDSHGIIRLKVYVDRLRAGGLGRWCDKGSAHRSGWSALSAT